MSFRKASLVLGSLVAVLLLSSCASQTKYEPRSDRNKVSSAATKQPSSKSSKSICRSPYHVKKGDTLGVIAQKCRVDMKQLARLNELLPPYIIYIKQKLDLPDAIPASKEDKQVAEIKQSVKTLSKAVQLEKSKAQSKPPSKPSVANKPKVVNKTTTASKPVKPPKNISPAKPQNTAMAIERSMSQKRFSSKSTRWQWPMHKGLSHRYRRDKAGLSVLEIYGIPGQSISAVAPGKVVYAGNGIANYGWMVVIKHDAEYMSIYAHNSSILVKEGDWVATGDEIALLGATGDTKEPKLYLEARLKGRKIDIKKKLKK